MKFETNKEIMENLSLHCLRASTIFLHLVLLTGAPNENIVQNHLYIALLNVF